MASPNTVSINVLSTGTATAARNVQAVSTALAGVGPAATQGSQGAVGALSRLPAAAQRSVTGAAAALDRLVPAGRSAGTNAATAIERAVNGLDLHPMSALGTAGTEKAKEYGKKVGGLIAAGIGLGGIGGAITDAFDWQNANARTAAVSGLSGADAKAAGKAAGELYVGGMAESAADSNQLVQNVLRDIGKDALNTTDTTLTQVGSKSAAIADAFGKDAGEVTRAVGQMLKTGVAPDVNSALDTITAGFKGGLDAQGDYLDTLNEYSTQAQKLGLDGVSFNNLLGQMMAGGARNSDLAADALKEFSIRVATVSKTTDSAFTSLGLNADEMYKAFGSDDTTVVQAAFDKVTKGIQGIQDPVTKATVATELFGTQSEDLGFALNKIDVTKAIAGVDGVTGSTQKLSDTLYGTATSNITTFWRTIKMQVTDYLLQKVVPALTAVAVWLSAHIGPAFAAVGAWIRGDFLPWVKQAAHWLGEQFGPMIREAADWLSTHLGPAFKAVGDWIKNDFLPWLKEIPGWYRQNKAWLDPLLVGLGAMLVVGGAVSVGMKIWTAVTKAYAAGMALLNLVMKANPFVLIVTLLVGLGAALVYAYKHSETFRNKVDAVWKVVSAGAKWMWEKVLSPIFEALKTAFSLLWGFLQQVWVNIGQPIWDAISGAATFVWEKVLSPIFGWISGNWSTIWTAIETVWNNTGGVIFSAVGSVLQAAWDIVSPIFTALSSNWGTIWTAVETVWSKTGKPVFDAIGVVFVWLRDEVFKPVWTFISQIFGGVGTFFSNLGVGIGKVVGVITGVIETVTKAISAFFSWLTAEEPTSQVGTPGASGAPLPDSGHYEDVTPSVTNGFTGRQWVSGPAASTPQGSSNGPSAMADGGFINPSLGGPRQDNVPLWVSGGEFVVNAKSTAMFHDDLKAMNDAGRYADGGAVGRIMAARASNTVNGRANASMAAHPQPTANSGGNYSSAGSTPVNWTGGAGVEQWRSIALQALAMEGEPASLIGSLLRRMNQESGGNPNIFNLDDSNARKGVPSGGLMQTIKPTFDAYARPGYSANMLDPLSNILASIRYAKAVYGSLPAAYDKAGGYDQGGFLPPGGGVGVNNLREPEAVLTPEQWRTARSAMTRGGGGAVTIHKVEINVTESGDARLTGAEVEARFRQLIIDIQNEDNERGY